jgi:hypothetical protein
VAVRVVRGADRDRRAPPAFVLVEFGLAHPAAEHAANMRVFFCGVCDLRQ